MSKLKYLLVMPRIVSKIGTAYRLPAGICYISAAMKTEGFDVINLNLNNIEGDVEEILEEEIKKHNIDVLGVGGLISMYSKIKNIVDTAKKVKPSLVTIVGGGVITACPELTMSGISNADFGIIAEGEYSVCEVSHALENGGSFNKIKGILYRDNGNLIKTQPREDIDNLDELPYPDYKGFGMGDQIGVSLQNSLFSAETRRYYLITSRSCTHNCTFCFHTSGKTYRTRSLDNVFKEIDMAVEKYNINAIDIADEIFANNMDRVSEFCRRIKNYNIEWVCQVRVDVVTKELVEMIKDSGCVFIGYGIKSADDTILKSMAKGITKKDIENALKITSESGLECGGNLIFGDKSETWETAHNSLNWYESNKHFIQSLARILVYPGTYLYKYAVKNGIIKDELDYIEHSCPNINITKMSDAQSASLFRKVDELNNSEGREASEVKDLGVSDSKLVSISVRCPECDKENIFERIDLFDTMPFRCNFCSTLMKVDKISLLAPYMKKSLYQIGDRKIVFWGAKSIFLQLLTKYQKIVGGLVLLIILSKKERIPILKLKIQTF